MEKDKIIGESLSHFMIHEKNFEVFLALSKKEADLLFKSMMFDIVICEYHLLDGDGFDILREWMNQRPDLFSIIMTVKNDDRLKKEASDSGIKGYLIKPFGLNDLEKILSNYG